MNMFEFVGHSKNDVRVGSMFNKMVDDTSLPIFKQALLMLDVNAICPCFAYRFLILHYMPVVYYIQQVFFSDRLLCRDGCFGPLQ